MYSRRVHYLQLCEGRRELLDVLGVRTRDSEARERSREVVQRLIKAAIKRE